MTPEAAAESALQSLVEAYAELADVPMDEARRLFIAILRDKLEDC